MLCKKQIRWALLLLTGMILQTGYVKAQSGQPDIYPMAVGFSFPLSKINDSSMARIKSVGIDCIEIAGISALVDKQTHLRYSDDQLRQMALKAKKAADKAGVKIWSIHMGYGSHIDLSERDESKRQKTITFHKKVLDMCEVLRPQIILFHPSWYLGLHERQQRTDQLIKSCKELLPIIEKQGATMVVENMLGFELQKDEKYERPLCRTVEETKRIFSRLPAAIGSAIDMNHIKNPEKLILAMGGRLKTLHVADGNGKQENHYLPCSGKGENNWNAILGALYTVRYRGPFMFECHYKDISELPACYNTLYEDYQASIKH
ncbi:sugar phosphate isomerase/epimerase family protein [Arachidicoccus terrestris]|uniref:sugar phosphate isomerase/epimerase family protein n=1 Tax=Arachidicoccus terrestris TaxID=2875539 RepID=UPI001CC3CB70|nr:sugar phosphate isomerase/epimerase family protein [Arachidicoccus terrestris]UAY55604.1 sugar phosphate isomerase/epimerase [Arachidicoccus terrestris]